MDSPVRALHQNWQTVRAVYRRQANARLRNFNHIARAQAVNRHLFTLTLRRRVAVSGFSAINALTP